jgi:hypothetical protein
MPAENQEKRTYNRQCKGVKLKQEITQDASSREIIGFQNGKKTA